MSTTAFSAAKYQNAANRALSFIKNQMNVSNWNYEFSFDKDYSYGYGGMVTFGFVKGLNPNASKVYNNYITPDRFYDFKYKGTVSGSGPSSGGVVVLVYTDNKYEALHLAVENGRWRSYKTYRETYLVPDYDPETGEEIGEHEETVEYTLDYEIGEGIKMFQYGTSVTSKWVDITVPGAQYEHAERLDYTVHNLVSESAGGGGYPYFTDFIVRCYTYSDTEYLNDEVKIYQVETDTFLFFSTNIVDGTKVFKLCKASNKEVLCISGGASNVNAGKLPASFLIPEDDPQYDKDGSKAKWVYGYCLNSRTWAYDAGLALLVFTTSGDYALCKEIMNRLAYEQNYDGSFNFSYDIYIGQLFEGYTRTGAQGWVVWGMCYYVLKTGDYGENDKFYNMIKAGGKWIVEKQIKDNEDYRYGLLTGGHGAYNQDDYSYIDTEIEWCSTEHQCSALQALHGCSLVMRDEKDIKEFHDAAKLLKDNLYFKLYDKVNDRFFQGLNSGVRDAAWALDCTSWAGDASMNITSSFFARKCKDSCIANYLTNGKTLVRASDKEHYNMTYSSPFEIFGAKPYKDSEGGYEDSPDIVWTEGTLGLANLSLKFADYEEAKSLVDECIKMQNMSNSHGGVLYVSETYASLPWEFHVWESVVSSAWLYLIIRNPDVLFPRVLKKKEFMIKIKFAEREYIDSHLSYIYIAHEPNKLIYEKGEALDITGLVVKAVYSSGEEQTITDSCLITGFNTHKKTTQRITVTYEGYKCYFYTHYKDEYASSLYIDKTNAKVLYRPEDTSLVLDGLIVYAVYDETQMIVTDSCSYSGFSLSKGEHTITVKYLPIAGNEMTSSYKITVIACDALVIEGYPTKTTYIIGEQLNLNGLILMSYFSNDTYANVKDYATYEGFDNTVSGVQTITAKYGGKTAQFNVTVMGIPNAN